jgi:ABC-type glycerol-3-phosphate transport system substrate-binding protein
MKTRVTILAVLAALVTCGAVLRSGIFQEFFKRGALAQSLGTRPKTVLRVWDWWSPATDEKYGTYFGDVKREFERRHPDVEVVYQYVPNDTYEQKMATALAGGSPPDVFQSSVSYTEGFYDRGMLLPLNGYLARERAERERRKAQGLPVDTGEIVEREAFLESAWRHNTKPDGTVFGIPQILDASCLVWNLSMLEKAAVTDAEIRGMFERKPDGSIDYGRLKFLAVRDWAQFRRIVRKLTKFDAQGRQVLDSAGEPVQAGFAMHAHEAGAGPFMPWCAANGSNFQDSAGTRAQFAGVEGLEAMQHVLDLYWTDRSCPPFRRQLSDEEVFNRGQVACSMNGTWSGKYITRNTDGKMRFDFTPFPPGPRGQGPSTVAWGNMLVISSASRHPDLAWDYVKLVASLQGSLRLLKHIQQNSPRKDFYETPHWQAMVEKYPYLHNIAQICDCGKKLRHTQIAATSYACEPIFETLLLRYPEIKAGRGPFPSVKVGLETAATAVNRVYDRYNAQVAVWRRSAAH